MRSRWVDGARRLQGDRGSATAELVVALPAVALVLALCLGAVMVGAQQVRLTDAAADAARALGRGDDAGYATSIARKAAGELSLSAWDDGDFVCARVESGSGVAILPISLAAASCALSDGR